MCAGKVAVSSVRKMVAVFAVTALGVLLMACLPTTCWANEAKILSADAIPIATPGWETDGGTCEWQIDESTRTLTVRPIDGNKGLLYYLPWDSEYGLKKIVLEGQIGFSDLSPVVSAEFGQGLHFSYQEDLVSIEGLSNLDTSNITSMNQLFYGCSSLRSLDLSGWDTSKVESMIWMFTGCSSLQSVDLSGLASSKATDLRGMFMECGSLESLDLSGLDTSRVKNMNCMFEGCYSLETIDVSGWDTSKVTNMAVMFFMCQSLENVDVSGFDTSSVDSMSGMFSDCSSLTGLDVSGFDTSKVTDMSYMFDGCQSLHALDVSGFDTSRVANMSGMFFDCSSVKSFDVGSFDTSSVADMSYMFENCLCLSSLNLESFDTSRVVNWRGMISDCPELSEVTIGPRFRLQRYVLPSGLWRDGRGFYYLTEQLPVGVAGCYKWCEDFPAIDDAVVKLSKTSFTYSGKTQKPKVSVYYNGILLTEGKDYSLSFGNAKNVGTVKIIVKGKSAFVGQKAVSYKIVPAAISISKLKSAPKALAVSWKAPSKLKKIATGYQIRYSTSKAMKNAKVKTIKGARNASTKITKLKSGKKYYVQLRSYKKVGKATYYSSWSSKKAIKAK